MKLMVQDLIGDYRVATPEEILVAAEHVINRRYRRGIAIAKPADANQLFMQKLAKREQEVFAGLLLDNKHRVIVYEEFFFGTIDSASVYPRVIVQCAMRHNAAAMIVAHNHPSGSPDPSRADENITLRLMDALKLVDVRLLDHIVVGDDKCVSLAQRGVL